MRLKCDGVFEGGGVKGTGFLGAVKIVESYGYQFQNVAGTSAGAIIAAMVAAGFSSAEMEQEMKELDYEKLRQKDFLDHFGGIGELLNIILSLGIYRSDYFETWLSSLLKKKNKIIFKDIKTDNDSEKYKYKLQVIASDLTDKKLLVLPGDLVHYGIDPDYFPISTAVRMSMSIPFFFKPYRLKDKKGHEHLIVDGGLLSNYPVWLLDDGTKNPPWPTFGFKFTDEKKSDADEALIKNCIHYGKNVVSTLLEAHDRFHISTSKGDFQRTIMIPTEIFLNEKYKTINTTYFDITEEEKESLFKNGEKAALNFFKSWNFDNWKKQYRR